MLRQCDGIFVGFVSVSSDRWNNTVNSTQGERDERIPWNTHHFTMLREKCSRISVNWRDHSVHHTKRSALPLCRPSVQERNADGAERERERSNWKGTTDEWMHTANENCSFLFFFCSLYAFRRFEDEEMLRRQECICSVDYFPFVLAAPGCSYTKIQTHSQQLDAVMRLSIRTSFKV